MRYLFVITPVLLLTVACLSGDASNPSLTSPPTRAPGSTLVYPTPAPFSEVPEGQLILQNQARRSTYMVARRAVSELPQGAYFASPDRLRAAFLLADGDGPSTGIGVIDGDSVKIIQEWAHGWFPVVSWSRDGARLAFSVGSNAAGGTSEVWVANADGSDLRQLLDAPDAYPLGWAADGRVVVSSSEGLALINDTGAATAIPAVPEDETFDRTLSHDGSMIAAQAGTTEEGPGYVTQNFTGLWVYEIASGQWTKAGDMSLSVRQPSPDALYVSADSSLAAAARKGPPPLAWSPDGTHIAFTKSHMNLDTNVYTYQLWLAHLDGGEAELLGDSAMMPVWSPDSRYVAFVDADGRPLIRDLEGGVMPLDYGVVSSLAWSPAGVLVASIPGTIKIYDPASGETREALDEKGETVGGAYIAEADGWSPSGRYVAFSTSGDAYPFSPTVSLLDTEAGEVITLLEGAYWPAAWLGR